MFSFQLMEAVRSRPPSVSYRVSTQQSVQPEDDLPPSYPSLVLSDNKATEAPPPSYLEVVDNPTYIQIHSPLTESQQGLSNAAFEFDFQPDCSINSSGEQKSNEACDSSETLQRRI